MIKIFAIIVNYQENKKTLSLLQSLSKQHGNFELRTIVVDNSGNEALKKYFPKKSPKKILVVSKTNLGFAKAVNKGIRLALHLESDFIWLINPDIVIAPDFLKKLLKNKADIVGPVIKYQKEGKWIYDLGGKIDWKWGRTEHHEITSNKYSSSVSEKFNRINKFSLRSNNNLDYLSGCCLLIRRRVIEKIGLLDERFFLYFEDVDFQVRAKRVEFKIVVDKALTVTHYLKGQSKIATKPFSNLFHNLASNLFFILKYQKNLRLVSSLIYLAVLIIKVIGNYVYGVIKENLALISILSSAFFLRTFEISKTLVFTHEIGRDYLVAKSIVFDHAFTLLGPPSSHPWLFHGPFFYYLLALFLGIFHYSPYSGYFLVLAGSLINIFAIYYISTRLFNKKIGVFASLFAAFVPWMVALDRLPAHYSLVPLFSLLSFGCFMFYVNKFQGKTLRWLVMAGFIAGLAVQFHLSSFILVPFSAIMLLHLKRSFLPEYIFSFLLPLSPLFIYDSSHNFKMLKSFILWLGYRVASQVATNYIYLILFLVLFIYLLLVKKLKATQVLILFIAFGVLLLLIHGQPPLHYFYFLYPSIFIFMGILLSKLWSFKIAGRITAIIISGVLIILSSYNFLFLYLPSRLFPKSYPSALAEQKKTVGFILRDSKGAEFAISRYGFLDQFNGYLDNYLYLIWWMGGKINNKSNLSYLIFEDREKLAEYLKANYNKSSSIFDTGATVIVNQEKTI